jgi:multiple sugar transport system ATP-binding protein
MAVRLENVHKSYGAVPVVKGLDLAVADGEFLVLLGASGCGKTTALRMVAGLETVTSGRIEIGGRDVTHVLPKHRDIAMVFQSYALYPHMTVAENIGYPMMLRKVPTPEREALVRAAAAKVDMTHLLDRYPRQLSGGQRQRVALARAIIRKPNAFLMDEPLSNLDAKLRGAMRAELKHLHGELGITTIYVTHDQVEAMTLADRIAVMSDGVVQQIAAPRTLYADPANLFVAGFIGSPPTNFVHGDLVDGAFRGEAVAMPITGHAPRTKVTMGLRPEDLTLSPPETAHLTGTIFSVELLGAETLITALVQGRHVVARGAKDFAGRAGEPIGFTAPPQAALLFDAETGARLRPAA